MTPHPNAEEGGPNRAVAANDNTPAASSVTASYRRCRLNHSQIRATEIATRKRPKWYPG